MKVVAPVKLLVEEHLDKLLVDADDGATEAKGHAGRAGCDNPVSEDQGTT